MTIIRLNESIFLAIYGYFTKQSKVVIGGTIIQSSKRGYSESWMGTFVACATAAQYETTDKTDELMFKIVLNFTKILLIGR